MTVNDCAKVLLGYFSPEERTIPDSGTYPGRNASVMKALNSTLQDLFGKGGRWVRGDARGHVLRAPTTVTIAVTNGSTAGTVTGWASWMAGCTIVIDGMDVDNQIRNAASTVVLKFPYSGTTGSHAATVYNDSVEVDTDVFEVHQPVEVDGRRITPIANVRSLGGTAGDDDFQFAPVPPDTSNRVVSTAGVPMAYAIDTWSASNGQSAPTLRMQFYPAPGAQHFVSYPVMLCPPVVTDLASTVTLPIPFQFVESIFMPMAVAALRSSPFWRGIVAEDSVEKDERKALAALADANPKKTPAPRIVPLF